MQTPPQARDELLSKLTTQEKQFLHVLYQFPSKTRWEHVYKAWQEVPKKPIELLASQNVVVLYDPNELPLLHEDLVQEAFSGKPSQVIQHKLPSRGPKGEQRTVPLVNDDTFDMMELPLTEVVYDAYDPMNFGTESFSYKTYLFLWPDPIDTARGTSAIGFTYKKRVVKK